jgi:regulatory protein
MKIKILDIEAARVVAFRFLGYSARSRAEIQKRLERDEFPDKIITQVIGELETAGYLDDTKFAQDWVEDRADRKRYGRTRLAAELNRKGVDRESIQEALEGMDEDAEFGRALRAAEAKWDPETLRALDFLTFQAEKKRIAGFLQRRGFSWQTITKVLAALMENKE